MAAQLKNQMKDLEEKQCESMKKISKMGDMARSTAASVAAEANEKLKAKLLRAAKNQWP